MPPVRAETQPVPAKKGPEEGPHRRGGDGATAPDKLVSVVIGAIPFTFITSLEITTNKPPVPTGIYDINTQQAGRDLKMDASKMETYKCTFVGREDATTTDTSTD